MTWPIAIVASEGIIANILNHPMPFPFSKYSIWVIGKKCCLLPPLFTP
jgi:hypothetical protein